MSGKMLVRFDPDGAFELTDARLQDLVAGGKTEGAPDSPNQVCINLRCSPNELCIPPINMACDPNINC